MITSFTGLHRFLSNFWRGDPISYNGLEWPTVEHAYQAHKTLDRVYFEAIHGAPTPGVAKRMGRAVPLRSDWEEVKLPLMRGLIECKFSNPPLAASLLNTAPHALVEGNDWGDTYWGAVLRYADGSTIATWVGYNWLGVLLMAQRAILADGDGVGVPKMVLR